MVYYKELSLEGEIVVKKTQVFCANPQATRKVILRELFNLSSTSSIIEILKAKVRLPPLPKKIISQVKMDNMKVLFNGTKYGRFSKVQLVSFQILFPQISTSHRWF